MKLKKNECEDNFEEYIEQLENEEDIGALDQSRISEAVISGTDWTTETILNQINKGNILLDPEFQRRDAWTKKRKSKFIESLIIGFPIPQLVFAEKERGKYIVLDGKQRLISIRQFAAKRNDQKYNVLKLTGLDVRSDLNDKSLYDLKEELDFAKDVDAFENETIRTVVIRNWPDETFLYHVFLRLNTESCTLSPQELRLALHPGDFIRFIDESSKESAALRDILKNPKPDFRMRDAELLLRYYAFVLYIEQYKGNLKKFLDDTCIVLNKLWKTKEGDIRSLLNDYEETHQFIYKIFKENAYRKWTGSKYETRFNRAIYDIMFYVFYKKPIRDKLINKAAKIEDAFKELCKNDPVFVNSIEQTTKSIEATRNRLYRWINIINKYFHINLSKPRFSKGN